MSTLSLTRWTTLPTAAKASARLPLIDALRAIAASTIAWHHFALYLCASSASVSFGMLDWLRDHGRATPIFFVVGGFVMAQSMSRREWNLSQVGRFIAHRYCRLGLPYLAAIALAIAACDFARGTLPDDLVGEPPTLPQLVAHLFFLQDILGYPSLSAGLWFVCVIFQLVLIYAAMLWLRDAIARWLGRPTPDESTAVPMLVGWALAISSLFYFNVHLRFDIWPWYFFCHFFLGVMVHHGLRDRKSGLAFGLYVALVLAALVYEWRLRLATSLVTGLVLFAGGKLGIMKRWPSSRAVQYLGRTSYSLFLIHFSVLVVVATVWAQQERTTPWDSLTACFAAYLASLVVADLFYRAVEIPTAQLSRRLA